MDAGRTKNAGRVKDAENKDAEDKDVEDKGVEDKDVEDKDVEDKEDIWVGIDILVEILIDIATVSIRIQSLDFILNQQFS